MAYYNDWGFAPYVSAAERRRKALREMEKRKKKGQVVSPVVIQGRAIAKTFWGKSWCENLERYSDYSNRLPRGRTYVRNGSVIDLQIASGNIQALVSGSEIYEVTVKVTPVAKARWKSICEDCAGAIDSLVELLQGRFSKGVMERICRQGTGLFPSPKEIRLSCSCPDGAYMCKHVAAVLYGIGARFDEQPELLFRLHEVDHQDLIASAGKTQQFSRKDAPAAKILADDDLSGIFGLDMAQEAGSVTPSTKSVAGKAKGKSKSMGKAKKKTNSRRSQPLKKIANRPKVAGRTRHEVRNRTTRDDAK